VLPQPVQSMMAQDPLLSRVKLIAEPWDVGMGGYQLGGFPVGWSGRRAR
jgi:isoamylase